MALHIGFYAYGSLLLATALGGFFHLLCSRGQTKAYQQGPFLVYAILSINTLLIGFASLALGIYGIAVAPDVQSSPSSTIRSGGTDNSRNRWIYVVAGIAVSQLVVGIGYFAAFKRRQLTLRNMHAKLIAEMDLSTEPDNRYDRQFKRAKARRDPGAVATVSNTTSNPHIDITPTMDNTDTGALSKAVDYPTIGFSANEPQYEYIYVPEAPFPAIQYPDDYAPTTDAAHGAILTPQPADPATGYFTDPAQYPTVVPFPGEAPATMSSSICAKEEIHNMELENEKSTTLNSTVPSLQYSSYTRLDEDSYSIKDHRLYIVNRAPRDDYEYDYPLTLEAYEGDDGTSSVMADTGSWLGSIRR
ncbi:uncharacterized protein SPPG_09343 [Spizellomyces punctatus DAOM BR117]|uniref:Uncharacterized protein n=1 Tax=Spizellomyces punctatus (strain DAOM BR117) TaxID=645134 RepID=A0A0L0H9W9_SPIPD|nr:uncharacterized protein SPPG_09343 [Spizellomyces punctatus DAOM BR117]KNC98355.1 hypothetical protein SPPG_09343 [Spizellomyces punctatus DAOM BR117]|eukprot:XP_016606395.1 hypothetical protein SPPG_09343 [Spizellomyces punctatus DAOM BR117]